MFYQEKSGNPARLLHLVAIGVFTRAAVAYRVASFFLVQHTKSGENIPNNHKIYQMTTKYTKITGKWNKLHRRSLQNLPD
jgi:hypothetical protein